MPAALVVGASRGLGLEFAKQYLADGWQVFASHRTEGDGVRLRGLGAQTIAG
jgi:NAD(P)-dependent dehydrogenase (short-subunit alcohol dehydrogenase family)